MEKYSEIGEKERKRWRLVRHHHSSEQFFSFRPHVGERKRNRCQGTSTCFGDDTDQEKESVRREEKEDEKMRKGKKKRECIYLYIDLYIYIHKRKDNIAIDFIYLNDIGRRGKRDARRPCLAIGQ